MIDHLPGQGVSEPEQPIQPKYKECQTPMADIT